MSNRVSEGGKKSQRDWSTSLKQARAQGTDGSLSQIRKQLLFPEMQRDHIHSNSLEQIECMT